MAQWWNELKDGEPRIFGFVQIDIVGSSSLAGPQAHVMRTKANLRNHLTGITSIYDVMPLSWAGDGGVFALLIHQPESYDLIAQCSLHLLETVAFFNGMKGVTNLADAPISVRISCHAGQAIFNREGSLFHGPELNSFLKSERDIGVPNSVVITEAIYSQLTSPVLRNAFAAVDKKWTICSNDETRTVRLYISPKPTESSQEVPWELSKKSYSPKDVVTLAARAFIKLGIRVKIYVIIAGMEVDLLIEDHVSLGPPMKTIVECKSYMNPVGIQDVRILVNKLMFLSKVSVKRGVLLSTSGFTKQASIVAESQGLTLITIEELLRKSGGIETLPPLSEDIRLRRRKHEKWAFVLMPFKKELDDIYYFGIRQPLEQSGYVVQRADEIQFTGGIVERIRQSIEEADVVIAEMTDTNPNVYYEVGLAHAMNKPVILITRSIENLPFDLRGMRHITYETAHELVGKLLRTVHTLKGNG
jgi:hypothetical protein